MTTIDKNYYARRAREERAREKAATTAEVAQVHAELAKEYEELVRKAEGEAKA